MLPWLGERHWCAEYSGDQVTALIKMTFRELCVAWDKGRTVERCSAAEAEAHRQRGVPEISERQTEEES
jgi:hypothetical protein